MGLEPPEIASMAAGMRGVQQGAARLGPPEEASAAREDAKVRVRIPYFPLYPEVRYLLRVWPGRLRKQVTGLHSTLLELRGTPQKPVDWTDPATWIPQRLAGEGLHLAQAIWDQSGGAVNPRFTYGSWQLAKHYDLLRADGEEVLELTKAGQDFLEHPGGETEAGVDEGEGLVKLLSILANNGPIWPGGLVKEWGEHLARCFSPFRSRSTIRNTMDYRLKNLLDRGLVERKRFAYSATPKGLAYLKKTRHGAVGDDKEIWNLVRQQKTRVRQTLHEMLHDMDPFDFEHLIKRLLEEMDYQNVEVTSQSGDGGIDVVADIELGITSVREVVQAKRHRGSVPRTALDALRGSLYRFDAVRGTIVTTSRFAKGTQEAAFATGAAPITLIDGEKLVDLLIKHGIGVRKRRIELLDVDKEGFAREEFNEEEPQP